VQSEGGNLFIQDGFEPLLDSKEAAALLRIHPKTLQRMARRDEVPAHRIGDLWRYRASELELWLRSHVSSESHSCRNQRKENRYVYAH
jgi:excisionase family DNA binding protein